MEDEQGRGEIHNNINSNIPYRYLSRDIHRYTNLRGMRKSNIT